MNLNITYYPVSLFSGKPGGSRTRVLHTYGTEADVIICPTKAFRDGLYVFIFSVFVLLLIHKEKTIFLKMVKTLVYHQNT
jgi:hypothetical protein